MICQTFTLNPSHDVKNLLTFQYFVLIRWLQMALILFYICCVVRPALWCCAPEPCWISFKFNKIYWNFKEKRGKTCFGICEYTPQCWLMQWWCLLDISSIKHNNISSGQWLHNDFLNSWSFCCCPKARFEPVPTLEFVWSNCADHLATTAGNGFSIFYYIYKITSAGVRIYLSSHILSSLFYGSLKHN